MEVYQSSPSPRRPRARLILGLVWTVLVAVGVVFATRAVIDARNEADTEEKPADSGDGQKPVPSKGPVQDGAEEDTFATDVWQAAFVIQTLAFLLMMFLKRRNKPLLLSLVLILYIGSVNFQMFSIPNKLTDAILSIIVFSTLFIYAWARDQLIMLEKLIICVALLSVFVLSMLVVSGAMNDIVDVPPNLIVVPILSFFGFAGVFGEIFIRVRRMGALNLEKSYDDWKNEKLIPLIEVLSEKIRKYREDVKPFEDASERGEEITEAMIQKANQLDQDLMNIESFKNKLIQRVDMVESRALRRAIFAKAFQIAKEVGGLPQAPKIKRVAEV